MINKPIPIGTAAPRELNKLPAGSISAGTITTGSDCAGLTLPALAVVERAAVIVKAAKIVLNIVLPFEEIRLNA